MGQGDLPSFDSGLHGLGTIEQRQRVAHRGESVVVDDGDLILALSKGQVAAHFLGTAQRAVGGAGFVLADDGIQGILALARVDHAGNEPRGYATLDAPLVGQERGFDALATKNNLCFTCLRVLGYADGFQHALIVDVAGQRLVHGQMHARVIERAGFVGDEGQLGRIEVE